MNRYQLENRLILVVMSVALLAPPISGWAQVLIEGFENSSEWSVSGNDIDWYGATVSLAVSSDSVTGNALEVTYGHSGHPWFEIAVEKTFASPVDLSHAMEFQLDVKGDATANSDLMWYVKLFDNNGKAMRFVDYGPDSFKTAYKRVAYSLGETEWDPWGNTAEDPVNLSSVTKVRIYIQILAAVTSPATAVMTFDNLTYKTTSDRMNVTVLEDFEYLNTAALQSAWSEVQSPTPPNSTVTFSLNTTEVIDGGGALQDDMSVADYWYRLGFKRTFPSDLDLTSPSNEIISPSGIVHGAVRASLKGDTVLVSATEVRQFFVAVQDSAGNQARWFVRTPIINEAYQTLVMYPSPGTNLSGHPSSPLMEDPYDAGGNINLANITKLYLYYQDDNTGLTPYNLSFLVDRIEWLCYKADLTSHEIPMAVEKWQLFN